MRKQQKHRTFYPWLKNIWLKNGSIRDSKSPYYCIQFVRRVGLKFNDRLLLRENWFSNNKLTNKINFVVVVVVWNCSRKKEPETMAGNYVWTAYLQSNSSSMRQTILSINFTPPLNLVSKRRDSKKLPCYRGWLTILRSLAS